MDQTRILVADDDGEIRDILRVLLKSEGFEVVEAAGGVQALEAFNETIDLVILDVMMPGMSGYQVCMRLREKSNVPILFLTAKDQDSDLTLGFSSGGDDYLSKPFSYAELLARVKGLLRRYRSYRTLAPHEALPICWKGLTLHLDHNEVTKNGEPLSLTDTEYGILSLMLRYRGKLFSAQNLYESVWEEPYYFSANNTVMVHIRRLREKIEDDPQSPTILKTVWGKGYRIE